MFKPFPTYKRSVYKIFLPLHIYHKMLGYALASEGEISGFGKVKETLRSGITNFQVTEIRIFRQVVEATHTRLHKEFLAKFIVELANEEEDPSEWNCWWHSHNDFGVGFSGIDDNTIEDLCKNSSLVSICINKAGDLAGRFDEKGKSEDDDVPVIIEQLISPDLLKACKAEVKRKVKFKKDTPYVMANHYAPVFPRRFDPTEDTHGSD